MKYHKLLTVSDPKIIGVNNGIYQCEIIPERFSNLEAYRQVESTFARGYYREDGSNFVPDDFEFEHVRLLKKAKITDIIGYCPNWISFEFILSLKAKQLMTGLNLPNCSFFPVQLYDHRDIKVEEPFYMLKASYHKMGTVDFSKSIFYTGSEILGKRYHEISSHEDFLAERENYPLLMAEKIALKQGFADSDFIKTLLGGPFISEKLFDRWLEFGVTGFKTLDHQRLEVV